MLKIKTNPKHKGSGATIKLESKNMTRHPSE